MKEIKFYFHPACPRCEGVRKLLDDHGLSYKGYNVVLDWAARRRWREKTESMEVPLVEIDRDVLVAPDARTLKERLGI